MCYITCMLSSVCTRLSSQRSCNHVGELKVSVYVNGKDIKGSHCSTAASQHPSEGKYEVIVK